MHAVDWFEIFRPAKLVILKRLDQTEASGSIPSLAAGRRIPEDLEAGQPGGALSTSCSSGMRLAR